MPKKATDRSNSAHIPFRCSADMYEQIEKIAQGKNLPMSAVLRSLVEDGLVRQGYHQDEDYLYSLVKQAVSECLTPHVKRLAAISAKGAQAAGAAFSMSSFVAMNQAATDSERDAVEEAAGQSRDLGIQFLKLEKTRDLDKFLTDAAKELRDIN